MATTGYLTRRQAQSLDERAVKDYGMSSLVLMENAGRGCADVLCRLGIEGPVVICCGRGNNGGDGFVLARHLDLRGYPVDVWMADEGPLGTPDAATNLQILRKAGIAVRSWNDGQRMDEWQRNVERADWIIDALLGTGVRGAPRPPFDQWIEAINEAACRKLAIDLPSGLDCDEGTAAGVAVRADHTCTFVAPKAGCTNPDASAYTGKIHVVDIGAPRQLVDDVLGGDVAAGGSDA